MLESPSRIAGAAHRHTGKGSEGVGERSTSLRRGPREETCRSPCQFSTTACMRLSSALEVFLWQQKVRVSVGLGCPRPIAGRSLRPSWPPLSRRRLRFAIHGSAGRLRRFLGRGQPILHKLQKPNREPISDRWSGDTGTLEEGERGSTSLRRGPREETCRSPCRFSTAARMRSRVISGTAAVHSHSIVAGGFEEMS